MQARAPLMDDSISNAKKELRRLAKEIEGELMSANLRKSFFSLDLLGQVLELYQLDGDVARGVKKVQGKQLDELRQDLFALLAQVGKSTSDEALGKRIGRLMEKYVAGMPKRGRPKRITRADG